MLGCMPVVAREAGFIIRVRTRYEHNPPHVHVERSGVDIRVLLNDLDTGPTLWDVMGKLANKDVVKAVELVWKYQEACLDAWSEYNGHL